MTRRSLCAFIAAFFAGRKTVGKAITPDSFLIYTNGFCHCSVCTTLSAEEATERVNQENPTGIESRWSLLDLAFATGEPNPCPCERNPGTHKHYLFTC